MAEDIDDAYVRAMARAGQSVPGSAGISALTPQNLSKVDASVAAPVLAPQAGQTNWRMTQPLILRRPITSRASFS